MEEQNYGPSPAASVVLNLGENIGALIIEADASRLGAEIEISSVTREAEHHAHAGAEAHTHPHPHPHSHQHGDAHAHGHARRTHSMVRERLTLPHPRYDAVYPDLPAGSYTIWRDATTPAATVTVTGGQITIYKIAD